MDSQPTAGTRVRIITDPGRVGVLTGKTRERAGELRVQVHFPLLSEYLPLAYLDVVEDGGDDPLDLLRRGRFATPPNLRRTLTHARLAGRLANVIYSIDTTDTDFYAYQFKPLVKLLNSATTGMLIADEVGLGKTIEAGLIWTELRSRFEYDRLLVLCPAMLRGKWQRELRKRFGVEATIVDAGGLLQQLNRAAMEPDSTKFALIASLQGARPRRGWDDDRDGDGHHRWSSSARLARLLDGQAHQMPLLDLVVIDEAHYLRNPETMTSKLGQLVRAVCNHIVLLSATPVHLRSRDLYELVHLADPDTFNRPDAFDDLLEANEPLVQAQRLVSSGRAGVDELQESLTSALQNPLLSGNRQIGAMLDDLNADTDLTDPQTASEFAYRLDTANLLGHVINRTRRRDVQEWRVTRQAHAEPVPMTGVEQEFYEAVTDVVREYCLRSDTLEGFLLVMPQRQISSSMPAAFKSWMERQEMLGDVVAEDIGDDFEMPEEDADLGPLVSTIVRRVGTLGDYELLKENDSKYRLLIDRLRALFNEHPKTKIILFSYFRPTLDYLKERLTEDGVLAFVLHGGTVPPRSHLGADLDPKDEIIASFEAEERGAILLASEVASEGIDLQFAWTLINYDLPWNPMRVEQRIGRIDRLGQKSPRINIWNLFYSGTIDERIYNRLYMRLRLFEQTLGGLEPILGGEVRKLAMALFTQRLTPEQEEARIEQTSLALENRQKEEETLEQEAAHLMAYGDYIVRHVNAARELSRRISGEDLRWYVAEFFVQKYPGCEFHELATPLEFDISLSSDARHDLESFLTDHSLRAETRLARVNTSKVRCRFENSVVSDARQRCEIINKFHPLVRFVSGVTDQDDVLKLRPAVAIELSEERPAEIVSGLYVFSVQRWWMKGLQEMEYLHYAAIRLDDDHVSLSDVEAEVLVGAAGVSGVEWLTASSDLDSERIYEVANEYCLGSSDKAFERKVAELKAQNDDRAQIQERTLDNHFMAQSETLRGLLERQRAAGMGIASATEGRLRALTERVERRKRQIADRRQFDSRKEEICVGVIKVE